MRVSSIRCLCDRPPAMGMLNSCLPFALAIHVRLRVEDLTKCSHFSSKTRGLFAIFVKYPTSGKKGSSVTMKAFVDFSMIPTAILRFKPLLTKFVLVLLLSSGHEGAKALDAQFRYATFVQPGKGPYVETYLAVNSRSVHFIKFEPNKLQGAIQITIRFERNDSIVLFDKYILKSPEIDTLNPLNFSFIDLQRFSLPAGTYYMQLDIRDQYDTTNTASASGTIELKMPTEGMQFSDVMLVESLSKAEKTGPLTKSGLDLVPRPSFFYNTTHDTLRFYTELYGSKQLRDSVFVVRATLEFGEKQVVDKCSRFYRLNPKTVNVITDAFLIDEVPSGNYTLRFQALSRENQLLAEKTMTIQRLNSKIAFDEQKMKALTTNMSFVEAMTEPQLRDYIASVRPISEIFEREYADNLLKQKDIEVDLLKKFMLSFWERRDKVNPQNAWSDYHAKVKEVNELFSSKIMRGYETERGRVYLQYGKPNTRTQVTNEPSAYPYEIWWYYEYKGQRNIRFVFYNPDMITNDYQLLHSEALGETFDPQWRLILFSRTTAFRDIDEQMNRGHFGSYLEDNFRNQ
jgi:GWxTD domain-containing protein